jgi:hypothetical protein
MFLISDPHKTKSFDTCDELLNGHSLYDDQVLGACVILVQKLINFISFILHVFCMVCECCVGF